MTDNWRSQAIPIQPSVSGGSGEDGWRSKAVPSQTARSDAKPAENWFWSAVDDLSDIAASAGSGLAIGTADLIGLPGDVEQGIDWLADKTARLMGATPPKNLSGLITGKQPEQSRIFPTSGEAETALDVPQYKPRTTVGRYLQTVAEFVPGTLTGEAGAIVKGVKGGIAGMKAVLPELSRSLGKWAAVPGAASEAAGEVAHKYAPDWENAARIAGALAGGGGGGAVAVNKTAPIIGQELDKIIQSANAAYKASEAAGVVLHPTSVRNAAHGIAIDLNKANFFANIHKESASLMLKFLKRAGSGRPMTLTELDQWRQVAREVTKGADDRDVRMGMKIIDGIDDYLDKVAANPKGHTVAGDAGRGVVALKAARRLWQMKSKAETIEDIFHRAKLRAGANYTQAGMETALRHQFAALAKDKKRLEKLWTPDEQQAIIKAAIGDTTTNAMRLLGEMAIRGSVSGMFDLLLGQVLGWPAAVAAAGVGEVAKRVASHRGVKAAEDVSEIVRGGTPSHLKPLPPAAALGAGSALAGPGGYGFDQGGIVTKDGKPAERWRYVNGQYVLTQ